MSDSPDKPEKPEGNFEDFGIKGLLDPAGEDAFLVAPTTGSLFNTLSIDLVPVACLQLHDVTFGFDSSFVTPEAGVVLDELIPLREQRQNKRGQLPPIGIFGHADPVGDDDYNKALSGRRARAIFGLLVRDPDTWVSLHNAPFKGDNWQTQGVLHRMRDILGDTQQRPLKAVIADYMARLFPNPLKKSDFLAQGKDKDGKGDYQGCGEFNPLIVLSKSENQDLTKEQRNRENQPNRRVVIYLFKPGLTVKAALWPCPRFNEPPAGCKPRFFASPPGDVRRQAGAERRDHDKLADTTGDVFACRLYDRIAHLSPCEAPKRGADFRYGLEMEGDLPWSTTEAKLTIAREDGVQKRTFAMAEGEQDGDFLVFLFRNVVAGKRYRGEIRDSNNIVLELFPFTELFRIQESTDPLNNLPTSAPNRFAEGAERGPVTQDPPPVDTDERDVIKTHQGIPRIG